jgi:hypothetical protein
MTARVLLRSHADLTAHIVLDGVLMLAMNGESSTYRAGKRCDVPTGSVHSVRMGASGCRYSPTSKTILREGFVGLLFLGANEGLKSGETARPPASTKLTSYPN